MDFRKQYLTAELKHINSQEAKRKSIVKKIFSLALNKGLNVSIYSKGQSIDIQNEDFSFNFYAYWSKDLYDLKDGNTVPIAELLELVKKYKKQ
ncbi:hypothetical protein [Empedobacter brevis]|uniref:hypothetical protein n=1 Tax=Empedobacter brevis TaxID=247 RepID=UPI00289CD226|nr:hypothetical protein [Empedobacter brevis]